MRTIHSALAAAVAAAFIATPALAHNGEDHSAPKGGATTAATPPAAGGADRAAAHRQSDGGAFVPKRIQRQLGIRTVIAERSELARTFELAGRVVADPNAGGVVQASQSGRIEPGPQGLPMLGQRVAKGQVLGYVSPVVGNLDRYNQQARLAELASRRELAARQLARYESLEGSIPRKDLEAARLELESLDAQRAALAASLASREPLVAPVAGVVSAAHATAGQVVEARDVLFEIVDPARLMVEALAHDARIAADIADAAAAVGTQTVALAFVGGGQQLREQALPLLFRMAPPAPPLAVGQPIKIAARTKTRVAGARLPAAAVVRNGAGEAVVWIHDSAERFFPKRVQHVPLDAASVAVVDGVDDGDRVVVLGAAALAQVR